ncbi:3'(2'),5'-bisphosphate nucleotidase CysQ [Shumkonia mesophila]|uniref:3'(2'),5'-bisphosphate nucleotidase CysQ n=1 Tax=Shumkonia mesophila TaxID=2838854 RepID=UPI002934B67A|nr:3'(2'),5'-bisphosphate nucleotidase CysQ [Shumkonia mesophila]
MALDIGLRLIDQLRALAERAGIEVMAVYNSDFAVDSKEDRSPVTEADRRAETLITNAIRNDITDAIPIVGEEAASAGFAPEVKGQSFWLIDPLDGTKEFVKRGTDFTVNIALIEGGRPVLGVIHVPVTGDTFWGSRHGAFASTGGGAPRQISCRPRPEDGVVAIVSRSHRTKETDDYLKGFAIAREISVGSSLKFCRVAAGEADLYPRMGRTMEWDTAAGHAILRFAGGTVRTLEGHELSYGKPGFENPYFVATGLPS